MKTVRVYELQVKHECVPEIMPRIDRQYFNQSNGYPHVIKYDEVAELRVNHERIKIQEFKIGKLPIHRIPLSGMEPVFTSEYIAIPEDLERLLMIKWQSRIDEVASKLHDKQRDLRKANFAFDQYKYTVKCWWDMPWYRRAWSAIRGEI